MKAIIGSAVLVMATIGMAAHAQESPAEPQAERQAKQEKRICRTEKATGSLTRRTRLCLTQAQWQELNNGTRKGLDEFVATASGAPKCLGQGVGC